LAGQAVGRLLFVISIFLMGKQGKDQRVFVGGKSKQMGQRREGGEEEMMEAVITKKTLKDFLRGKQ